MDCSIENNLTNGIWGFLIGLLFGATGYLVLSSGLLTSRHRPPPKISGGLGRLGS